MKDEIRAEDVQGQLTRQVASRSSRTPQASPPREERDVLLRARAVALARHNRKRAGSMVQTDIVHRGTIREIHVDGVHVADIERVEFARGSTWRAVRPVGHAEEGDTIATGQRLDVLVRRCERMDRLDRPLPSSILCPSCWGHRRVVSSFGKTKSCVECSGLGVVEESR